jgi:hypothetical protein
MLPSSFGLDSLATTIHALWDRNGDQSYPALGSPSLQCGYILEYAKLNPHHCLRNNTVV